MPGETRSAQRSTPGHQVVDSRTWKDISSALRLSPRELEITQGIFDDRKELAIARQLGISAHTVHSHIERLYRKLDVSSRVQLVVRVLAELQQLNGHTRANG